jgi:hypothetical protein
MDELDATLRAVVVLGSTATAVLWILRQAIGYQRDFTGRYAARNLELEQRIDVLEEELDGVRRSVRKCELREVRLIGLLLRAGVDLPPDYHQPST